MGIEPAVSHDTQPSGALGDEHRAIGQKRDGPRLLELARDHDQANVSLFSGFEFDWSLGNGGWGPDDRCRSEITALLLRRERLLEIQTSRGRGGNDSKEADRRHDV